MTGLVSALLPDEAEVVSEVVERAGGNPLYAREYARLLADAGRPSWTRPRRSTA